MTPRQEALEAISGLDRKERAVLAAHLLAGLEEDADMVTDPVVWDELWDGELERRLEDLESGRVEPVAGDQVRQRLQAILDGE